MNWSNRHELAITLEPIRDQSATTGSATVAPSGESFYNVDQYRAVDRRTAEMEHNACRDVL